MSAVTTPTSPSPEHPTWERPTAANGSLPLLAYVAGLVDGEGCISIQRSGKRRLHTYAVRLDIGMSVKALPLLRQVQGALGGSLRQVRTETTRWSEAWAWMAYGSHCADVMAALLPWLVLKRGQTLIALAFQHEVEAWRGDKSKNRRWPEELRAMGERAYVLCQELNSRGPGEQPMAFLLNGQWEQPQGTLDLGLTVSSPILPKRGSMRSGLLYEHPTSAPVTDANDCSSLLPTPTSETNRKSRRAMTPSTNNGRRSGGGQSSPPALEQALEIVAGVLPAEFASWDDVPAKYLPTPTVGDSKAARNSTATRHRTPPTGVHDGNTLTDAVTLLPTPRTSDANGRGSHGDGGNDLRTTVSLLPTPTSRDWKGANQRNDETCLPGAITGLRSADGSTSSDGPPRPPPTRKDG